VGGAEPRGSPYPDPWDHSGHGPLSQVLRLLTRFGHSAKSFCLISSAPFEKSVDNWRRKGATPQRLRDVRLWGDQCEDARQNKDDSREGHSGRHARLASRQSRKKPKDAVRPGKHGQVAAIEHDDIARVAIRAVETGGDGQQDNRQEKEEVQIEHGARCVWLVGQPALVGNSEHTCNNKADQKRENSRLVCGPNCGPDWRTIQNLTLGKIIGEQCHRDAKNRVAQSLKASHLEEVNRI
jgi:hypothetical protein